MCQIRGINVALEKAALSKPSEGQAVLPIWYGMNHYTFFYTGRSTNSLLHMLFVLESVLAFMFGQTGFFFSGVSLGLL